MFGRSKPEGAPLTGGDEFSDLDFAARTEGSPTSDMAAHVRLAHPNANRGVRILRRGYNYVDGSNDLGQMGAGLFFISFQRDPASFMRVQRSLEPDLLNEYIRHIGWACGLCRAGYAAASSSRGAVQRVHAGNG